MAADIPAIRGIEAMAPAGVLRTIVDILDGPALSDVAIIKEKRVTSVI